MNYINKKITYLVTEITLLTLVLIVTYSFWDNIGIDKTASIAYEYSVGNEVKIDSQIIREIKREDFIPYLDENKDIPKEYKNFNIKKD